MKDEPAKLAFILPPSSFLLGFLVIRMLTAASAELLELQAIRSRLLVLRRHVIAAFTIAALQYNVIAWHYSNLRFQISNLRFETSQTLLHNFRHSARAHSAA